MIDYMVNIAGFKIKMTVTEMYYPIIAKKLKQYMVQTQEHYDANIFIYDEGGINVNQRYADYKSSKDVKSQDIVFSYAKGGMFGYFDHRTDIGCYYISRVRGNVKRNPLLPLYCSISVLFPKHGALLFHCSAVIDEHGKTHLFTGESGSGKTTIAKMMHAELGFDLIADDTVVLKVNDYGQVVAYTTPFWDVLKATKECGIVESINAIFQSTITMVRREDSSALLVCLLKNALYRAPKKEYSSYMNTLLITAYKLSKCCKHRIVYFEKNLDFWREISNEKIL